MIELNTENTALSGKALRSDGSSFGRCPQPLTMSRATGLRHSILLQPVLSGLLWTPGISSVRESIGGPDREAGARQMKTLPSAFAKASAWQVRSRF